MFTVVLLPPSGEKTMNTALMSEYNSITGLLIILLYYCVTVLCGHAEDQGWKQQSTVT